jgi:voltage-gated potassium channel
LRPHAATVACSRPARRSREHRHPAFAQLEIVDLVTVRRSPLSLDIPLLKLLLALFALVSACVAIHGVGVTLGLRWWGRSCRRSEREVGKGGAFWVLISVVYGLLILHLLQILVWAAFYQLDGCFPNFETSFYFSATSYSTVGYGDVILPRAWRVLGSIEGVTGVLMFGWSTGVLFMIAQHTHGQVTRSNDPPAA